MSEIPYTPTPGKIRTYFDKFQEVGVPPKVNRKWMGSINFGGGNDQYIIAVLKHIGFIDNSCVPTDLWRLFKDTLKSKAVLAQGIRQGYAEILATYPDAHKKDRGVIYAFFSSKTGKAKATVDLMVSTFINLCQLADFEAIPVPVTQSLGTSLPSPTMTQATPTAIAGVKLPLTPEGGIRLDVSIRIELPVTQDADVYDKIFKSLKKHLLTPSSETD